MPAILRTIVGVALVAATTLVMPGTRLVASDGIVAAPRLLADAANGTLDEISLLEASLIASGVEDESRLDAYVASFNAIVERCEVSLEHETNGLALAEALYELLHREVLTGKYFSKCTEVDRAFDHGDYNCVTATILYQCLCQRFGLSVTAVATSTHVRSRLSGEPAFDVETTCPDWFDVVRRTPTKQSLRRTQLTRQLSAVELLAKVYYNRGVNLLESNSFASGIELLKISQLLDPEDAPTRKNLAAGLNNWALAECDAGNYEHAVELVELGIQRYPEFDALLANDVHIHQRWATQLLRENQFEQAMRLLQLAYDRRPKVDLFDRGRIAVLGQWAAWLLANDELQQTEELFDHAAAWCSRPAEIATCRAAIVQSTVRQLRRQGQHEKAENVLRWNTVSDPLL